MTQILHGKWDLFLLYTNNNQALFLEDKNIVTEDTLITLKNIILFNNWAILRISANFGTKHPFDSTVSRLDIMVKC